MPIMMEQRFDAPREFEPKPPQGPFDSDPSPESPVDAEFDWPGLVERVRRGDAAGMEELYHIFEKGIRFFLCRQLGTQELNDKVHDTFVIVVQAIQRGELREPERVMGFVRTIVRRQVAGYINQIVASRREEMDVELGKRIPDKRKNPEQNLQFHQRVALMRDVLEELSEKDREILTRFYLREQTTEEICEDMNLSETQFRLLKSRAKGRFGELGKRKLHQQSLFSLFRRSSDS